MVEKQKNDDFAPTQKELKQISEAFKKEEFRRPSVNNRIQYKDENIKI